MYANVPMCRMKAVKQQMMLAASREAVAAAGTGAQTLIVVAARYKKFAFAAWGAICVLAGYSDAVR